MHCALHRYKHTHNVEFTKFIVCFADINLILNSILNSNAGFWTDSFKQYVRLCEAEFNIEFFFVGINENADCRERCTENHT